MNHDEAIAKIAAEYGEALRILGQWEEPCVCDTDFTCLAEVHDEVEEGQS